jgi:hypothetical protein
MLLSISCSLSSDDVVAANVPASRSVSFTPTRLVLPVTTSLPGLRRKRKVDKLILCDKI